jgi:predicted alpha/beta superfamily hydrolase
MGLCLYSTMNGRRAHHEGRIYLHARFPSRFLSTSRNLIVYVPPGYSRSEARYPVLYLQDGQNLFDPATAFGGQDWRADIIADELSEAGVIDPPIIVGIYNTGIRRISEYTPTRDRRTRKGGKADRYAQMMAREIKPFIDREYRTRKPAGQTAVGGSSLGGLVSLMAGFEYPRVFGKLAILSPSVWWDAWAILGMVERFNCPVRPSIWLDTGTAEGDSPVHVVEDARRLRDALLAKGWREGIDLRYCEAQGAGHNEQAWAARLPAILEYLFPRRPL